MNITPFVLLVLLPIALLAGWFVSEFQARVWLRIVLGIASFALCAMLAVGFATLFGRYNYNAWYGAASAELIETTITEIEAGRSSQLVPELRRLREDFRPTYENRAHYDELVKEFVSGVKSRK